MKGTKRARVFGFIRPVEIDVKKVGPTLSPYRQDVLFVYFFGGKPLKEMFA
jgi:hypothetical protein